jgi:Sec-independent protein translocase protein TatA
MWGTMINYFLKTLLLLVVAAFVSGCAHIKEAGRTIGHTTRDVTREIGHGTRDVAKEIGQGSRDAATTVGDGVKEVVKPSTAPAEY